MQEEHREPRTGFPASRLCWEIRHPGLLLTHRFLNDTFNLFILSLPMVVCLGLLEALCEALMAQLLERRRKEPP